jgi:hypothetical protein
MMLLHSERITYKISSRRAYSNRTRIKTFRYALYRHHLRDLVEHIPIEQGLRLPQLKITVINHPPRRAYSNRTRIKTCGPEAYPNNAVCLVEHIPIEQGLRHLLLFEFADNDNSRRAYSNRTRIKTTISPVVGAK